MGFVKTRSVVATIDNAASLSDGVECFGMDICRISMPAVWTAAEITFQVSDDGGTTYRNLYMEWGFELGAWVEADWSVETSVFLNLQNIDHIKIRSGSAGAPVAQGGERLISLELGAK